MRLNQIHPCTICGEPKSADQVWFLVTESGWQDRLKVLQWNDDLALRWGIHRACCPAHVQELVAHWMVNGSLDDLFAAVEVMASHTRGVGSGLPIVDVPDTRGVLEIAELSVDREGIRRALNENPDSLQILLDELSEALQRAAAPAAARLESGANFTSTFLRQI